ncbi:MAG: type IV secretion system protein [Candidatus Nomurabacteria bacterium]|jgi:hypothetical protein|nr:type IV secretion system protein [Candidatus Nomurabacteria bacterium]
MNKLFLTRILPIIVAVGIVATTIVSMATTSAATDDGATTILKKTAFQGLEKCYNGNKVKPDLGTTDNYKTYESIIQDDDGQVNRDFVKVPNNFGNSIGKGWLGMGTEVGVNCKELLGGHSSSWTGLFDLVGKTPPVSESSPEEKKNFLIGMGYNRTGGGDGDCVAFVFSSYYSNPVPSLGVPSIIEDPNSTTPYLCTPELNSDGTIESNKLVVSGQGTNETILEFTVLLTGRSGVKITCHGDNSKKCDGNNFNLELSGLYGFYPGVTIWHDNVNIPPPGESRKDFVGSIWEDVSALYGGDGLSLLTGAHYKVIDIITVPYENIGARYKFENAYAAANIAIKYLSDSGYGTYSSGSTKSIALSETEKTALYQYYITEYYQADIQCPSAGSSTDAITPLTSQEYRKAKVFVNGEARTDCYVSKPQANEGNLVNTADGMGYLNEKKTFNQLLDFLDASPILSLGATYKDIAGSFTVNADGSAEYSGNSSLFTPPGGETEVQATCDLGPLGFIICPAIHTLDSLLGKMYEYIEGSLAIPSSFLKIDGGTYEAWKVFRNFANIAFVILLMIVIFSQVTSIGISNYGIKKILPRIIIVGILINVSYFICQIAVDLSNILGAGLNDIFKDIASGIGVGTMPDTLDGSNGIIEVIGLVIGIGLTGLISTALLGGWAVLFGLASFLITGLVSILMMFVALGFRQIGIIVLIAAAPLAMVCKLLPNTEKIFSSWWKMLKTLLVLYPICGVLVGGGVLVGRIVAQAADGGGTLGNPASVLTFANVGPDTTSSSNYMLQLLAALCVVLPYLGVFTLTKKALDGLGSVGQMLGGAINNAGTKLKGGLDKSPIGRNGKFAQGRIKNQQEEMKAKSRLRRFVAGEGDAQTAKHATNLEKAKTANNKKIQAQLKAKQERGEELSDWEKRMLRTSEAGINKENAEAVQDYVSQFSNLSVEERKKRLEQGRESGDMNMIEAAIKTLHRTGDTKEIREVLENFSPDNIKKLEQSGNIQRFADALTGVKDEDIGVSGYGALISQGKRMTFKDSMRSKDENGNIVNDGGELGGFIRGKYSNDVMTSNNASAVEFAMKNHLVNSSQIGAVVANSKNPSAAEAVGKTISSDQVAKITGDKLSSVSSDLINAYDKTHGAGAFAEDLSQSAIQNLGGNIQAYSKANDEVQKIVTARYQQPTGSGGSSSSEVKIEHGNDGTAPPTTPTINLQRDLVDARTGARVTADVSGQEVMQQISTARPAQGGEVNGSKQYWENAVGSLSNEQLQQIIQQNAKINAGGTVADAHYDQLAGFARKHLNDRGMTHRPPTP